MTHTVETEFGPVDIVPIQRDRARVETGIPMNVDDRSLRVNGVDHALQGWVYLWGDDLWHFGREGDRDSQLHEPRLTRRDGGFGGKEPSRSAYEKVRPAVERAVQEWAAKNWRALAEANVAWLKSELKRAEEREQEALDSYTEAQQAASEARDRLVNATAELESA